MLKYPGLQAPKGQAIYQNKASNRKTNYRIALPT
jgi:hypothetical protein